MNFVTHEMMKVKSFLKLLERYLAKATASETHARTSLVRAWSPKSSYWLVFSGAQLEPLIPQSVLDNTIA